MSEFKLIVAGGRDFNDYDLLSKTLFDLAGDDKDNASISIVSGMARGADNLAVRFARIHSVQLYEFPADWNRYGKSAGYRRNTDMAGFADGLLAFWDGQSRGTAHMIQTTERLEKPVWIIRY